MPDTAPQARRLIQCFTFTNGSVKSHPLSNEARIWNLLYAYPSRLLFKETLVVYADRRRTGFTVARTYREDEKAAIAQCEPRLLITGRTPVRDDLTALIRGRRTLLTQTHSHWAAFSRSYLEVDIVMGLRMC